MSEGWKRSALKLLRIFTGGLTAKKRERGRKGERVRGKDNEREGWRERRCKERRWYEVRKRGKDGDNQEDIYLPSLKSCVVICLYLSFMIIHLKFHRQRDGCGPRNQFISFFHFIFPSIRVCSIWPKLFSPPLSIIIFSRQALINYKYHK